jgi:hypothetical protein
VVFGNIPNKIESGILPPPAKLKGLVKLNKSFFMYNPDFLRTLAEYTASDLNRDSLENKCGTESLVSKGGSALSFTFKMLCLLS